MPLVISSLSREYVRVQVFAKEDGAAVDPTTDVVTMAFTAAGSAPISGDYKAAEWETDAAAYYARCLVGPGGTVALAAGVYTVWVKITDSPEIPVKMAGSLVVR